MKIAQRMKKIADSPTLAMDARAKQMIASGAEVINFGVGEPDFDTPEYIRQAGIQAIQKGITRYAPASGTLELKQAVCAKLKSENGLEYQPNEVIINCGAKHSIYNAIQCLIDPGDEVIVPAPYWVTYPEAVKTAMGKPVVVKTMERHGFKLTPEQLRRAITPKTKMLILNSPSNPTGAVYTAEDFAPLMELAIRKKIVVLSDEIYEYLIYGASRHVSPAGLHPKAKDWTIVINGVSKSYAMTGWRIGYAAGPAPLIQAMGVLQSHSTSNPASMAMKAALAALVEPKKELAGMVAAFTERKAYVVRRLNAMPGVSCLDPQGAFYVFPNVSKLFNKKWDNQKITNSTDLANRILDQAKVALVPGKAFGAEGFLRISYATSMEQLALGMDRLASALREIK
jgi:aspartate aminotransferase